MGNCLDACLVRVSPEEAVVNKAEKSKVLEHNHPQSVENLMLRKPRCDFRMNGDATDSEECDSKNSLQGPLEKEVLRVRIVLTKQEAAQLMSRCQGKDGGNLLDVVNELKRIKKARVSVGPASGPWRPVLESIPENP